MLATNTGLRFYLEGCPETIMVTLPVQDAQHIIRSWLNGTLKSVVGNADTPQGWWAINASKIICVHQFNPNDLRVVQQPQQLQPGSPPQQFPPRGFSVGSGL